MLASTDVRFELHQFSWRAPDRLQLSGTFVGLRDAPVGPPVLVLSGPHQTQRLPAVDGTVSGPPADGQPWSAEFGWQEPPVPFAGAAVHFGQAMVVELPEPGAKGSRFRKHALKVRVGNEAPSGTDGPVAAAQPLRLEAELLVAQDEARGLRAQLAQSREELTRALEDLESERARHADDTQRFRDGIAQVQASAETALAELRRELDEAVAARRRAEERTAASATTRDEVEAVRGDAERLLGRLSAMRDALADGS